MTSDEIQPAETRVRANGLVHRVLTWGPDDGETLVCAHGFLDHAWSFHFLAQHLAREGLRVVAFDWRGHGETEWIGAGGYYHFVDYLLDLTELVPRITRSPYHLLGHSMGGTACGMWAGTRPAGLASLVLCEGLGPPAVPITSTPDRVAGWLASVARTRAGAPRPLRDLDEAVKRMRAQHGDLDADLARWLAEKGTRPGPDGTRTWCFDPLHRTSSPLPFRPEMLCSLLARIEAKTLVVTGSRGFVTADHAERVASIPEAREIVLDDVGHMMHWHAAAALAHRVREHVATARTI